MKKGLLFHSPKGLFLVEGHTVGALLDRRVALMCADLDLLQRAIVFCVAVMLALRHRALNGAVCAAIAIHCHSSFVLMSRIVCAIQTDLYEGKI